MSFSFVLSYIDISDINEIKLIENHFLRKANDIEMKHINRELSLMKSSFDNSEDYTTIYEHEIIREEKSSRKELLPEIEWKYYIIDYSKSTTANHEIRALEQALMLLKEPIYFAFSMIHVKDDRYAGIHNYTWKSLYLEIEDWVHIPTLQEYDVNDFSNIAVIHQDIKKCGVEKSFAFIKYSLDNFYDINRLGRLPLNQNLKTLGYFSIIEMLVAHKPKLKESIDSISHQIITKYNLLMKQFERQVYFSDYFDPANNDKIWKKLYAYRSDLAHGNIINFESEYSTLKSSDIVNDFLNEIIKNTIILALKDPVFFSDLKQC